MNNSSFREILKASEKSSDWPDLWFQKITSAALQMRQLVTEEDDACKTGWAAMAK